MRKSYKIYTLKFVSRINYCVDGFNKMATNNNNDGAPMYVVGLQLIVTIDVWMNTNDGFPYVDAIRILVTHGTFQTLQTLHWN